MVIAVRRVSVAHVERQLTDICNVLLIPLEYQYIPGKTPSGLPICSVGCNPTLQIFHEAKRALEKRLQASTLLARNLHTIYYLNVVTPPLPVFFTGKHFAVAVIGL